MTKQLIIILLVLAVSACRNKQGKKKVKLLSPEETVSTWSPGSFGFDLEILQNHHEIILLSDSSGKALVAVSPDWQGRVMTSSFDGKEGISLGWINHEFIRSRETKQGMNPFGGEDRFWMGPEGGQFSIYFKPDKNFDLSAWQVPEELDTKAFELTEFTNSRASFKKEINLTNYSGYTFNLQVERDIKLLPREQADKILDFSLAGVEFVSYESVNTITNIGKKRWNKNTGALSVWILGMFPASEFTTVIIPFKKGAIPELGPPVNDNYFVKIPSDRLIIKEDVMFFKGDGKFRCKLGIGPKRALPFMGAYNEQTNVLTIVNINLPEKNHRYVNSLLEIQSDPFAGDVLNSYNDGPTNEGQQFGSYFELETSSPAAFLAPGESITHIHRTFHLTGSRKLIDETCAKIFGVNLDEAVNAFK